MFSIFEPAESPSRFDLSCQLVVKRTRRNNSADGVLRELELSREHDAVQLRLPPHLSSEDKKSAALICFLDQALYLIRETFHSNVFLRWLTDAKILQVCILKEQWG